VGIGKKQLFTINHPVIAAFATMAIAFNVKAGGMDIGPGQDNHMLF
jgi:hypothetical protein